MCRQQARQSPSSRGIWGRLQRPQSPTGCRWSWCFQRAQPGQVARDPQQSQYLQLRCGLRDDGARTTARPEDSGAGQARVAQHVGDGVAEAWQVVEGLLRDRVVSVGLADGQDQPEHEAGASPPGLAQPAFGGQSDRGVLELLVAGQLAVPDAAGVGVGELPAGPEQQELAADRGRADMRVVDRFGRGDAQLFQQRPGTGAVGCAAADRPVERLGSGEPVSRQDQHELRRPSADGVGDPFWVVETDGQQA